MEKTLPVRAETAPARRGKSPPAVVPGGRGKRLLSEAIQLDEEALPRFVRPALVLIAVLVALFGAWAATVNITEVATAPGEIVPSGNLKVVQHPEGGVVQAILVEEGQLVQAGQSLVRLDGAQAQAELDQMRAREAALRLRAERLSAFAQGRAPDFDAAIEGDYPGLVADQREIYRNQIRARDDALSVLDSQQEQRRQELNQLEEALQIARRQQTLTGELLDMRERLAARKLISQVEYLETRRAKVTADGEVARLEEQIFVAVQALEEIENRLRNTDSQLRQEALTEMGAVKAELAEVTNAVRRLSVRTQRLDIRAPTRGLVQNLRVVNEGEVVPAGGMIAHIVPVDGTLEAEVRIATRDIGHVKVGQSAVVKVGSYDYTRFGGIPGELRRISASSLIDAQGRAYFKGWVRLERAYAGDVPGRYPLLPGMAVQADVTTDEKTLLQYLLEPVTHAVDQAFHER